jgi:phosphatidylglycerophosphatase A
MNEALDTAPVRANARFMWRHPARWVALGFGSGLSPMAPGTVGTLWAWVAFLVLDRWLSQEHWALLLLGAFGIGWWACTATARHLRSADPGAIVWDEVLAFWIILWLLSPAAPWVQALAFVLFRYFDAAKPGPVRWADGLFKRPASAAVAGGAAVGWAQGFGVLFDDLVAALCTLLTMAVGWRLWEALA